MRVFDYKKEPEKLLTPEIVQMVSSIHEHKGKQDLFLEANIDDGICSNLAHSSDTAPHSFNFSKINFCRRLNAGKPSISITP